jgi:hypothetical protein
MASGRSADRKKYKPYGLMLNFLFLRADKKK